MQGPTPFTRLNAATETEKRRWDGTDIALAFENFEGSGLQGASQIKFALNQTKESVRNV